MIAKLHIAKIHIEVCLMKTSKIVVLTFSLVAVFLLLAEARDSNGAAAGVHEIPVTAKKYEFTPSSIHVKKGEHVKLLITAVDHDHGFKLPAFDIEQQLREGDTTTIEFTPDKAGTFRFACSHVCGFGHRGMKAELVVEE
jgi:cytochrome c oxidase subunit II